MNPKKYYKPLSEEEIQLAIKNDFIDMVILCWWEFLIYDIDEITKTIERIKQLNPNVLVRIDTNWSFPEKVKKLKNKNIVDWFAIDIKWPYWNKKYYKTISQIIWLDEKQTNNLLPKIMESIYIADKLNYSLFRTVNYPIIKDKEYFEEIRTFAKENLKNPHSFNLFINV